MGDTWKEAASLREPRSSARYIALSHSPSFFSPSKLIRFSSGATTASINDSRAQIKGFKLTLRHVSAAHNTARCYGTGKKTGAPVWPYDADYMRVTPTFREESPGRVVCLSRGRKKKKRRQTEKTEDPGFVDVLYCCHGRICFSTRTESEPELREDGFYFEVFPPIVHYCRELLPREAEVSKKGSRGFLQGYNIDR